MASSPTASRRAVNGYHMAFLQGDPIPGTLSPTANSAWAKVKSHESQTAADLRSIGYEVHSVIISWVG